jgi:hypothetical protein
MHDYQKKYMNGICTANGNGGPEFPVFLFIFYFNKKNNSLISDNELAYFTRQL